MPLSALSTISLKKFICIMNNKLSVKLKPFIYFWPHHTAREISSQTKDGTRAPSIGSMET